MSQCRCYKNIHMLDTRCPNRAKGPDYLFCGIHKNCRTDLIGFELSSSVPPQTTSPVEPPKPKKVIRRKAPSQMPLVEGIRTVSQMLNDDPNRSVWSAVMEQNLHDKILLERVMDHTLPIRIQKDYFDQTSERLAGQWHFGMVSHNIKPGPVSCKHGCTYCYETPTPGMDRYHRPMKILEIEDVMPTDPKRVHQHFPPVPNPERKMYFFPSTCDVFVENAVEYVDVCRHLIDAGHEIFFVTKPSIDHRTGHRTGLNSVQEIVRIIESDPHPEKFKQKMVIFITITTDSNQLIREYEPHASPFEVRLETVQFLIQHGFNTNIMMEPYLSDPVPLIPKLLPILESQGPNGIIAIGRMNYTTNMPFVKEHPDRQTYLGTLYSQSNLSRLWDVVKNQPRLYLKKKSVIDMLKLVISGF